MPNYVAANLTKYQAGGTGVNLVPDGYIKCKENIWLDSYTFSAVITTADTIAIAVIPGNHKITGVEVYLPATFAPTNATINVGISGSTSLFISSSTTYGPITVATFGTLMMATNKCTMNNLTGFQYQLTGSTNVIYLSIGVTAMTAPTAGTILTLVRYT